MDLDDLVSLSSARGRKAKPLQLNVTRELEEADISRMDEAKGSVTPPLVRIRTTHHELARLIAQGVNDVEAAAITGYSPSRISILKQDQAFKELITFYSSTTKEQYLNTHERLARLGNSFVDELQERLEEAPDKFSVGQLMEGAKFAFDRTVAPPKGGAGGPAGGGGGSAPVQVNIKFVKNERQEGALPQTKTPELIDITPLEDL